MPAELEFTQASRLVEPDLKMRATGGEDQPLASKLVAQAFLSGCALIVVAVPSLLAALIFRGGIILRALDLAIMKNDRTPASRLRVFVGASLPGLRHFCFNH